MAVRRSARQVAASRRNLAVARRRRRYRRGAAVVGVVGGVALAGYATRNHVRESGLRNKHGGDYIAKKAKYHHYTNNNAARRIKKTRIHKPTSKNGGHGSRDGVWLTTGKHDGTTRDVFGKARVTVKLKRRDVLGNKTHSIPGGLSAGRDKRDRGVHHVQVHKSLLQGKRVRSNLPKTARGTRSRVAGNIRRNAGLKASDRLYVSTRNTAVSPIRAGIKRRVKRR